MTKPLTVEQVIKAWESIPDTLPEVPRVLVLTKADIKFCKEIDGTIINYGDIVGGLEIIPPHGELED